jgi:hypothetical protein
MKSWTGGSTQSDSAARPLSTAISIHKQDSGVRVLHCETSDFGRQYGGGKKEERSAAAGPVPGAGSGAGRGAGNRSLDNSRRGGPIHCQRSYCQRGRHRLRLRWRWHDKRGSARSRRHENRARHRAAGYGKCLIAQSGAVA